MKIIYTLAIICILPFALFSQNYLSNNVTWAFYGTSYYFVNVEGMDKIYYWQYVSGDSTVSNYSYYKIVMHSIDSSFIITTVGPSAPDSFTSATVTSAQIIGLVRERGNNIYTVDRNGQDSLLWDFDLTINDQIPSTYNTGCGLSYIDSIKNVTFASINRRIFYSHSINTSGSGPATVANWPFIEGIGTYQGLFSSICGGIGIEGGSGLVCYSKDGNDFVFTPYYDTTYNLNPYFPPYSNFPCFAPSDQAASVNNITPGENARTFPNPASSEFQIQCSSNPDKKTYFRLVDATGREIMQEPIQTFSTFIQRGNLSNGLYFWEVDSGSQILGRGKIVLN